MNDSEMSANAELSPKNAEVAARVADLTVLCVGQVTHDRYGADIVAGGCAYFGARCAQALGARVRLLTSVGADFLLDQDLAGLEAHAIRAGATTVFTNTYPEGQARVQRIETVSPPIPLAALPASWDHADVLLLAPVFGEIDPSEPWFSAVHARVRAVCLQGFMKQADPARELVVAGPPLDSLPFFHGADAFFLSEEDIACFGGPGLLDFLRGRARLVFVTRGELGCTIHAPEGTLHAGVFPAAAVDPTGAGDTFAAATACALAAGCDPLTAARLGAAAASFVVEFEGSRDMPAVSQAWKRFSRPQEHVLE
ncbi:sugar kinase [Myxococcota bacterium]|nr:sugar kinase [Myxococcota bacterium]MBU1412634.1 sugar kinase [Myxococcota bacterium]MBU1509339.1 sugar kinase [Myxococcota bacterium]